MCVRCDVVAAIEALQSDDASAMDTAFYFLLEAEEKMEIGTLELCVHPEKLITADMLDAWVNGRGIDGTPKPIPTAPIILKRKGVVPNANETTKTT